MTISRVENLLNSLPRVILCDYKTPVVHLKNLERTIGVEGLYIKRDDLNGVGPGGNKVRALEYLLGAALNDRCNIVIASGQKDSNLCTIAAAACCKIGLRCILVHNNNEPEKPKGNALLNSLLGVERIYIGEKTENERNKFIKLLADEYLNKNKRVFVIENGATTPLGAIGYAHIPLELINSRESKDITDIFVPGGNGGFAAGVILGNILLGKPYNIHVITVEHVVNDLYKILETLIAQSIRILKLKLDCTLSQSNTTIYGEYRGAGWGISTPESEDMINRLAMTEGIFLEKIYTSKTLLGMTDLLKTGKVKATASCFVHSGGFASVFSQFD